MSATTLVASNPEFAKAIRRSNPSSYNVSIGYLRAFVTLLVLAHHAVLAYHPYAPPPPTSLVTGPRWWQAFPVSDPQRWTGFAAFVGFNDTFFMALMFFVSGIYVWRSLERKGAGSFLRDRAVRLGVPFVVAAAVVAPLAYYPTYLQSGGSGMAGFWHQWMSLGNWPAGPAWFVWVLLAFDGVAAALLLVRPRWGEQIGNLANRAGRRPIVFFGMLAASSAIAYLPLEMMFTSMRWSVFGPFTFQSSRIIHYFVYFLLGAGVGASGLGSGLLAEDGKLARRWPMWSLAAVVAFVMSAGVGIATITAHLGSRPWEIAADLTFVVSCAASSFAWMALFVRFAKTRRRVFDSLSANAYGMYLVHYMFTSWLQWELLKSNLPGMAKGVLVTLATVLLSWGCTALLRRIPAVARVI